MTRREILEKNWKEFRLSIGLKYEPMSEKAYEFMENAMEQYAEFRLGAAISSVCPDCGKNAKIIDEHRECNYCGSIS